MEESCIDFSPTIFNKDPVGQADSVDKLPDADDGNDGNDEIPEPDNNYVRHGAIFSNHVRESLTEDIPFKKLDENNLIDDLTRIKLVIDIKKLRVLLLNGDFSEASSYIQNRILIS